MQHATDVLIEAAALVFLGYAAYLEYRWTRRQRRRSYIRTVLTRKEGRR